MQVLQGSATPVSPLRLCRADTFADHIQMEPELDFTPEPEVDQTPIENLQPVEEPQPIEEVKLPPPPIELVEDKKSHASEKPTPQ